ncbi:GGDEF and EAL domain-containing protein [Marinomonas mediterranea]|jgi:PAS domain S-box/diguanylate cyclase (GGDEF) domain|uniref:Diguanylate cyclase/phosphodiesterase with PAS/PAC sensor(S) n=1 Tax=Marinomonas mediterranea (strain ATCC 700492 / JCM 21426 / NBRC 103028 / MMB-1) TaxID=717774 RepID=F2K340_MARM1|nr:GGDEF and EAL domain-containing protein [Marinomonas mediterranea]ADZ90093.1 diguanylate cyclase/phosphodiesterase with PAS/PAC sensor(s) [Marinomonas mediterranea MMB-1]WCN08157.1 EAL domain-containing protein [Marinomonas mediterranea]WCN12226.1 EAL domain-containing protein [Marinomonas mediterranea]WCN16298.1 EAL domain-containing protein [Marinomonas mediterranea MMB-1]
MAIGWLTIIGYVMSALFALAFVLLWVKTRSSSSLKTLPSLQSAFDIPNTPVCITSPQGDIRFCNLAFADLLHRSIEGLLDTSLEQLQLEAGNDDFIKQIDTSNPNASKKYEIWYLENAQSEPIYFEIHSAKISEGHIYFAQPVTHFKEKEYELVEADARMNEALKVTNIGVWEWDIEKDVWFATPSYFTMLGYSPIDGLGDRQKELAKIHPDDREDVLNTIKSVLNGARTSYHYQCRICHANGAYRWIGVRCTVTEMNDDGKPSRMLGVRIDIDALKKTQQQVEWLAKHDSLTQLPNRASLFDFFQKCIDHGTDRMALLFVDLDRFKNVNDTLGHRIGDQLLVAVAKRMLSTIAEGSCVVRQGGDEFIILLPNTSESDAQKVATDLRMALSKRFQLEQHQLIITPSIGISLYPKDGRDLDTLYKRADTAMYRAKQSGRNRFAMFTQEMQAHSTRVLLIENALHSALENNELSLHYQPQFSLSDKKLVASEALIRWNSHSLGRVSPGEFIPIAEDSGQIVAIGEWVITESIRQIREWIDLGYPPLKVAINLSYAQFQEPDLANFIAQTLEACRVPSSLLELELTERIAMDDPESAIEVINAFHDIGLETSIDDFGTGYSSLSYLQKLPVYKLKVDQSFVRNMINDENNLSIVSAIIALAKKLGMRTIAEGVETQEQLDKITSLGCDEVQGYLLGHPVPPDEFEQHHFSNESHSNQRKIG